ncbi:MAG TPA: hypothetical protein VET27_08600 [Mycobacterium sp.]|nr:hypothetical protein [Mycobacterium sp.]
MADYELFHATTLTPGAHRGPTVILLHRRGDGLVVRFQQGDEYMEAFVDGAACERLGAIMVDVATGWRSG